MMVKAKSKCLDKLIFTHSIYQRDDYKSQTRKPSGNLISVYELEMKPSSP